MKDKEFKRLRRSDLIDIIYELQKNEKNLREELEQTKAQLAAREIKIAQAGSIAEATIALSEILEKAQTMADHYLEQVYAQNPLSTTAVTDETASIFPTEDPAAL